jgi:hypothetical protein
MMNGSREQSLQFILPDVPEAGGERAWFQIIDTAAAPPRDILSLGEADRLRGGQSVAVLPQAVVVLQSAEVARLPGRSGADIFPD